VRDRLAVARVAAARVGDGGVWLGAIARPLQRLAQVTTGDAAVEENGQPGMRPEA
jgi:hypothetical protein